jgi:hypothetical protein
LPEVSADAPAVPEPSFEPPAAPEVSVERTPRSLPARLGIAVVTLISVVIIIFVLLVVLGFFRGKSNRPKAGAMASPSALIAARPWL